MTSWTRNKRINAVQRGFIHFLDIIAITNNLIIYDRCGVK